MPGFADDHREAHMKSKILAILLLVAATIPVRAISIATWTFETSPPADLNNSTTISGIAADSGTGTASGVHASAATDWSTPVGNGSANSLSANTWAVGDYFEFQVNTIGFFDIFVSFDQTSSSTGPRDFKLQYGTGSGFTDFANYSVLENGASPNPSWAASGAGLPSSAYSYSFDLSAIAAIEGAATVNFRLVDTSTTSAGGGTVASTGTDRVDNFTVSATATPSVPDTGSSAILLSIPLLGLIAFRQFALAQYNFAPVPHGERAR